MDIFKRTAASCLIIILLFSCVSCSGKNDSVPSEPHDKSISGVVSGLTMNVLTVDTDGGKTYHFNLDGAEIVTGDSGILIGNRAEVFFYGELDDSFIMQSVEIIKIVISDAADYTASKSSSITDSSVPPDDSSDAADYTALKSSSTTDSTVPPDDSSKAVLPETDDRNSTSAEEILAGMSMEEKVGQMFIARCPADSAAEKAAQYNIGGYILFGKDFKGRTKSQVIENINSYQKASKIPMLIGVDEEGGTVCRVSLYSEFRDSKFLSPQDLYAAGGFGLIESDTAEKAALLKSLGINVNFAPVSDVSTDSGDYIYKRAFGKPAAETARYVEKVVSVMKTEGMGSVLKHFPGYGNNADTHTGFSHDQRPYETFENSDFLPFIAGINAGADTILVSHNMVECMDGENPASLSPAVHRILREELGFDGVIITDDLYMDAIREFTGTDRAAVAAVLAGNDMLCCTDFETQIPAVIAAAESGEISEEAIDRSVLRVLKWKIKLGLLGE